MSPLFFQFRCWAHVPIDQILEFEVEAEDVVKLVKLLTSMPWELFQDCIAETMGCHETQLCLGYKLSMVKVGEKAQSLETLDEYLEMQQEIAAELEMHAVLQRKGSKAMKQWKALQVMIKDQHNKTEKKVWLK